MLDHWVQAQHEIEQDYKNKSREVSGLMSEIENKENEICSITERLAEIALLEDAESKTQVVRAKEKRAHLRSEIVGLRGEVRIAEADRAWAMMVAREVLSVSIRAEVNGC